MTNIVETDMKILRKIRNNSKISDAMVNNDKEDFKNIPKYSNWLGGPSYQRANPIIKCTDGQIRYKANKR